MEQQIKELELMRIVVTALVPGETELEGGVGCIKAFMYRLLGSQRFMAI